MVSKILVDNLASITELKKDPMGVFQSAQDTQTILAKTSRGIGGAPSPLIRPQSVAITNHNDVAFYCVHPATFSELAELERDLNELHHLAHRDITTISKIHPVTLVAFAEKHGFYPVFVYADCPYDAADSAKVGVEQAKQFVQFCEEWKKTVEAEKAEVEEAEAEERGLLN